MHPISIGRSFIDVCHGVSFSWSEAPGDPFPLAVVGAVQACAAAGLYAVIVGARAPLHQRNPGSRRLEDRLFGCRSPSAGIDPLPSGPCPRLFTHSAGPSTSSCYGTEGRSPIMARFRPAAVGGNGPAMEAARWRLSAGVSPPHTCGVRRTSPRPGRRCPRCGERHRRARGCRGPSPTRRPGSHTATARSRTWP